MVSNKEVVIIGAGAIGCSVAYHLAKRGVPSLLIEKDSIGARASGKAWAILSYPPNHLTYERMSPDMMFSMPKGSMKPWLELFWLGYHRWSDVAQDLKERGGVNIDYGEFTMVKVAVTAELEQRHRGSISFLHGEGFYECGWLEAGDLRTLYPDINPSVKGGMYYPAIQVEPYKYTLALAQAAEKMGATVKQGEVVEFRHKGSTVTSVILATGTEIRADVFVIATGPWCGRTLSGLGKDIPVVINREQRLTVQVPQPLPPYALSTPGGVILPKVNGQVVLGRAGVADIQPDFDSSLTEEEKSAILEAAIDLLPRMNDAQLIEHTGDLECWSPPPKGVQPVLGRLPEWDNTYVAIRLGTLGIGMSLGVGQVMADFIVGGGQGSTRIKAMMDYLSPARL